MPSYLFHVAFDLTSDTNIAPTTQETLFPSWSPPPHTDIFSTNLPVHQVSAWRQSGSGHKRSKTTSSKSEYPESPAPGKQLRHVRQLSQRTTKDIGRPDRETVFTAAQDFSAKSSSDSSTARDWRFDRISIESVDMEVRDLEVTARPSGGDDVSSGMDVLSNSHGLATKGVYVPSNPKNTEIGWGVVRLYRDSQENQAIDDETSSIASSGSDTVDASKSSDFKDDEYTTLCILAVPSYMTPSDLLGFVGEKTREEVSHFRLIRSARANKYMVLMKFKEARNAKRWRREWNGKLFNSMEPENCHVVYVKSIEFRTNDNNHGPSSYPNMVNDPFTPNTGSQPDVPLPAASSSGESSSLASSLSTKPLAPPTPALVELPTCPVCLERMDETTGLLTILCQHVFHCACLEKWRGSGCPVCRYTQNDSLGGRGQPRSGESLKNECRVCGMDTNLWICLICGHVGCGRYDEAHAYAHWEETSHSYAMDIATQHVWDYGGDGYVHRLIQTKADGKLVDLPAAFHQRNEHDAMMGHSSDTVPSEKLDAMGVEYTYLLTSQLDSQRAYFEEQVDRAADKAKAASAEAAAATSAMQKLSLQVETLSTESKAAREALTGLEKDLKRTSQHAEKADGLARKFGKDWREEKTINQALMGKIEFLNKQIDELNVRSQKLEEEKRDLEEQNRDLGFFISGGAKLQEAGLGDEIVDGKIEIPESSQGKGKRQKGRRK